MKMAEIPHILATLVHEIEEETADDDFTVAVVVVQVGASGKLTLHGVGDTSHFHTLGVLTSAAAALSQMKLGEPR